MSDAPELPGVAFNAVQATTEMRVVYSCARCGVLTLQEPSSSNTCATCDEGPAIVVGMLTFTTSTMRR